MKRALLLAVVLLALGCSGAQAASLVLRPDLPTNRLVLFLHGSGGNAESIVSNVTHEAVTNELLAHGFAVAGDDAGGPNNWGNGASVTAYIRLVRSLPYSRVYFWAESMGGLDAIQLIGKLHPEALVAMYPACNARALAPWIMNIAEEAWSGRVPNFLSPVLPATAATSMIFASPEDTYVPKRHNADVCAKQLRRVGSRVREVVTTGQHGDSSNFRPGWIVRFLLAQTPST